MLQILIGLLLITSLAMNGILIWQFYKLEKVARKMHERMLQLYQENEKLFWQQFNNKDNLH